MLLKKRFTKTKEDFICEHCQKKVSGNGYTNHCPYCLWSKHVDINPGDRAESCQGMMKPIGVEIEGKNYYLIHKCEKCNLQRRNKISPKDDFEQIIKLSS